MSLSYNDDNKKKIADKGGIEAIIDGMKKHIMRDSSKVRLRCSNESLL